MNFKTAKEDMPLFDQGCSALIEDLQRARPRQERGGGDLGRIRPKPKVNKDGGRPLAEGERAVLAGGGMRQGK